MLAGFFSVFHNVRGNTFYQGVLKKQRLIESRLANNEKRVKRNRNNIAGAEWKRFEATVSRCLLNCSKQ